MLSDNIKQKLLSFYKFKTAVSVIMKQRLDQRKSYKPGAQAMLIVTRKHVYTSKLASFSNTQIFRKEKI